MKRFKVGAYDVDGLLVDSHNPIAWSLNETLIDYGGNPIGPNWFKENQLGLHEDLVRSRGVPENIRVEEFNALFRRRCLRWHLYKEMPGASELLSNTLMHGMRVCLVSAFDAEVTMEKMTYLGMIGYVTKIYGGEDKAESFRILCDDFQCRPDEVVFSTDMGRDIDHALRAGVENSLAVVSDFSTHEQLATYGVPVFDNLHQLHTHFQEYVW